jgi:CHAT domain-containing protein
LRVIAGKERLYPKHSHTSSGESSVTNSTSQEKYPRRNSGAGAISLDCYYALSFTDLPQYSTEQSMVDPLIAVTRERSQISAIFGASVAPNSERFGDSVIMCIG